MRVDDLRIRLRRRSPWEAFELGRTMVREWGGSTYRAWAVAYGGAAAVVTLATWPWPDAAPVVLWWLKPFFDRVLLFVFSQHVFGQKPTVRDVVRALPTILRHTGLLSALTVYRLSPARALYQPIWQLEGQRGGAARRRAALIGRRTSIYAIWLMTVCSTMSMAITLSLVLLFEWLVPVGLTGLFSWDAWTSGNLSRPAALLLAVMAAAAESVVEPLYVASGFSLYLNRRSELEAWDVEVEFRRVAARRDAAAPSRASVAVAVLAAALVLVAASPAVAQEPPIAAAEPRPPSAVVREVLADPVFGANEQVVEWRPKPQSSAPDTTPPTWLATVLRWLVTAARVARLLVWPAGAALVAWLVWVIARRQGWHGANVTPPPDVLFGLDLRPQSLPADVPGHARSLVEAGDVTAALALLYRGALSSLVHSRGLTFTAGDTEADCARWARPVLSAPSASYFLGLIEAWQSAAYAHVPPASAAALALCDAWSSHFERQEHV